MDLSKLDTSKVTHLTLVEVQPGATNIQHVEHYYTEGSKPDNIDKEKQVEKLLKDLIQEQKDKGKGPKYILLPLRAAVSAGAISDAMTVDDFNKKYGTSIASSSYSECKSPEKYTPEEIDPIKAKFEAIMKG